jgi:cytochrome oxidase assembly protein ShyY1
VRFLLRPGWLAFIAAVVGFAIACYTLLAPWQFRRNAERERDNNAIATSLATPPVPLAELVPVGAAPTRQLEWRRVVVRGHYLPREEALVRLRSVQSQPAYEVLTVFRSDEGRTIAVDRGYLRPDDNNRVPAYPAAPAGDVQLTARIQMDETDPHHRPPLTADGHHQLYAVDSRQLANLTGEPLMGGYLMLLSNQPGLLAELPLPETDSGPFLSYAWQWLTFGAMALFGLGYFIRLELLQRRGDSPARQPEPTDPLVQRYGKSRL